MLSSVAAACFSLYILASSPGTLDVPGAYPTVQAAIDAAGPGDTVYVHAGTYDEALTFKAGITLEGEGKDRVTLRRPAADGPVLTVASCADGVIRGLSFEHLDRPAKDDMDALPAALVEITDSSVEVFNCELRNSGGSGVRIRGKSSCKVLSCSLVNNMRVGIAAVGADAAGTFVGNVSTHNLNGIMFSMGAHGSAKINQCNENTAFGIDVTGKGAPILFRNTCSKNGKCGIVCREDSTLIAHGNRCEENGLSGIGVFERAIATLQYNVLENNKWNGIWYSPSCRTVSKGNRYFNNHEFSEAEALFLFESNQFSDLEEIAARLRRDKTKSYNGEWELPALYNGIASRCSGMDKVKEREFVGRIREWKKAFPNSLTCAIAEADADVDFAWRERGSGWAREVTSKGWKGFFDYLYKGLAVVETAEKLPERDPHLYVVKSTLMLGLSKTTSEIPPILAFLGWWTNTNLTPPSPAEQAFLQGVAIEPTYYPLYYARTTPLLTRWGGSPAKMVKFAEWSAHNTAKSEGQSLYARIANEAFHSDGRDNYVRGYNFSWPRIRQGYRDIIQRYPDSNYWLNAFCFMACLYGDRETASSLFPKIGDSWNGDTWENKAQFENWKSWAMKKAPNPQNNPLEKAVRNDDAQEVERLLRAGGDPNAIAEDGRSMLVLAVKLSEVEVVKTLLANGADVNFVPPEGTPPIAQASWHEADDTLLRLLIDHKANPNVKPPDGWSPLLYSIGQGMKPRVRYLLEHGADPNDAVNGQTAIFHAVYRNDVESARALVKKGADVNRRDEQNITPLQWAERWKKTEAAEFLREHGAKE